MATSDSPDSPDRPGSAQAPASTGGGSMAPPNRLLAASRVVHQLWRTQDKKIDLNRLLADEVFAKRLLHAAKVYADPKTSDMVAAFEFASVETGAWRSHQAQSKPDYKTNADGSISAAAAWDPDYVPPISLQEVKPETQYVPTTSPRTTLAAKDGGISGFISRFGFSRPAEPKDSAGSSRESSASVLPSTRSAGPSTQNPASEPADGPIDPKHKKYIRGAR